MMKRALLTVPALLLAAAICSAQAPDGYSETERTDFRPRAEVTLGFKAGKNWDFTISEELRFMDNARTFDRYYTTFGVKYSPAKRLEIIGSYNFGRVHRESWTTRHRISGGLEYTFHAGDFRIALRELVQCTWRADSVNVAERANPNLVLRSRLRLSYKVPAVALTPYVGFELFNTLNSPYVDLSPLYVVNGSKPASLRNYICRYRVAAGLKYKFNGHTSVEAFYRYDTDIDYNVNIGKKTGKLNRVVKETELRHVVGVGLTHYF